MFCGGYTFIKINLESKTVLCLVACRNFNVGLRGHELIEQLFHKNCPESNLKQHDSHDYKT